MNTTKDYTHRLCPEIREVINMKITGNELFDSKKDAEDLIKLFKELHPKSLKKYKVKSERYYFVEQE